MSNQQTLCLFKVRNLCHAGFGKSYQSKGVVEVLVAKKSLEKQFAGNFTIFKVTLQKIS